mmetsp:Transcript_13924/g.33370  ORF Transcript_13924/g.33370 Transcript_13924/m.33370 type:complete len:132 (+) Transcript_13924:4330-4725(+)
MTTPVNVLENALFRKKSHHLDELNVNVQCELPRIWTTLDKDKLLLDDQVGRWIGVKARHGNSKRNKNVSRFLGRWKDNAILVVLNFKNLDSILSLLLAGNFYAFERFLSIATTASDVAISTTPVTVRALGT